jgi:hypothetical protein
MSQGGGVSAMRRSGVGFWKREPLGQLESIEEVFCWPRVLRARRQLLLAVSSPRPARVLQSVAQQADSPGSNRMVWK